MLFVVIVCCVRCCMLLFDVRSSLFVVCLLVCRGWLFVDCCLLEIVRPLLSGVCCLWFVVCRLLLVV